MTQAFDSIKKGLIEAREYVQGNTAGARTHVFTISAPDIQAIRTGTGLSQAKFAEKIGVSVGTLRGWEQGRRTPQGPARVLLNLLQSDPDICRLLEKTG